MEITKTLDLYNTLFTVSLTVAAIGLAAAILQFFLFDIPSVFALMTGRAKKKTIERMKTHSGQTGTLRQMERAADVLAKAESSGKLGKSSELSPQPQMPKDDVPETAILGDAGETTMLDASSDSPQQRITPDTHEIPFSDPGVFEGGNTEQLGKKSALSAAFSITEDTMIVHSNQVV